MVSVSEATNATPTHVLYGGAHRFSRNTFGKLGNIASSFLQTAFAGDQATGFLDLEESLGIKLSHAQRITILNVVKERVRNNACEDFRVDFEDGFRASVDDFREIAKKAATELRAAEGDPSFPQSVGIRIPSLSMSQRESSTALLEAFFQRYISSGPVPNDFRVALPKVRAESEVRLLSMILADVEKRYSLPPFRLRMELLVETKEVLFDEEGRFLLPRLVRLADRRLHSLHIGAYDFSASMGIPSFEQNLATSPLDSLRFFVNMAAGENVRIYDGVTNDLPLTDKSAPPEVNAKNISLGIKRHAKHVAHALKQGFLAGWDIHPTQTVIRWITLSALYLPHREKVIDRIARFVAHGGEAGRLGSDFDDAASVRGLFRSLDMLSSLKLCTPADLFAAGIDAKILEQDWVKNLRLHR